MQSDLFIVGEIGQAHNGSLAAAHSYIYALAETGVNAVKFQVHIAEAESSIYEPFRIPSPDPHESRMEYWKRMEFTPDEWLGLKKHCEQKGLEFIATPSCLAAADLLIKLDVQKFKVGSGDTNNPLLLQHIAKTGKELILSSGMSSMQELDEAVQFLKSGNNKISLLQCTSSYPAKAEQWGLNLIQEYKDRYNIPIGFSDHSGDIIACLAAVSSGAEILEFHVVFDKNIAGPDTTSSITIDQVTELIKGVRQIETALKNPVDKTDHSAFSDLKDIFEKSLAINKNLSKGHYLSINDLESKKPKGRGISVLKYEKVIGKQLNKDLNQWAFITENDLF